MTTITRTTQATTVPALDTPIPQPIPGHGASTGSEGAAIWTLPANDPARAGSMQRDLSVRGDIRDELSRGRQGGLALGRRTGHGGQQFRRREHAPAQIDGSQHPSTLARLAKPPSAHTSVSRA